MLWAKLEWQELFQAEGLKGPTRGSRPDGLQDKKEEENEVR